MFKELVFGISVATGRKVVVIHPAFNFREFDIVCDNGYALTATPLGQEAVDLDHGKGQFLVVTEKELFVVWPDNLADYGMVP